MIILDLSQQSSLYVGHYSRKSVCNTYALVLSIFVSCLTFLCQLHLLQLATTFVTCVSVGLHGNI